MNPKHSTYTQADYAGALRNLKRKGTDLQGPCPRCGGKDRFYVRPDGGAYCRKCCPDLSTPGHRENRNQIESLAFGEDAAALPPPGETLTFWEHKNIKGETFRVLRKDGPSGKSIQRYPMGVKGPYLPYFTGPEDAPIVIVEGEKCADAIAAAGFRGCTWPGGAGAWKATDWDSLKGLRLCLWPDADEDGRKAMRGLAAALQARRCVVSMVQPPPDSPAGWDCADAVSTRRKRLVEGAPELPALNVKKLPGARGAEDSEDAGIELVAEWASHIEMTETEWLWPDWLARGKIHLLAGEAGRGKTTIACKVAADLTSGSGDFAEGDPGRVAIYTGEEDWGSTLAPSLSAMGADLGRIMPVQLVRGAEDEETGFNLADPAHVAALAAALRKHEIDLFVADPVITIATGLQNTNDAIGIRKALKPLQTLIAETGCAVLGITHLRKAQKGDQYAPTVDRVLGSQAWGAVARIVWAVALEGADHVLGIAKSNIGGTRGKIYYEIDETEISAGRPGAGKMGRAAHFLDREASADMSKAHLLTDGEQPKSKVEKAEDWLLSYLRERWAESAHLEGTAERAGITNASLRRARAKLRKTGELHTWKTAAGRWAWGTELPEE